MNPLSPSWIIIPVHNRRETTRLCLQTLADQRLFAAAQIVVIESGSTDGTSAMIADQFPQCLVEHATDELWWTGAIKLGTQKALANGARTIVWLNDDCLPEPGAIETLIESAQRLGAICGASCFSAAGALTYSGGRIIGATQYPFTTAPKEPTPCDWLNGNLIAIPAAVFQRIGLPQSDWLPQTWGDVEFTYRAHCTGIPVMLLPAARAINESNTHPLAGPWLSPALRLRHLWLGWWNKKAWWYLPSIAYFKLRYFHLRGFLSLAAITAKMVLASIFKLIIPKSSQPRIASRITQRLHHHRRPPPL